MKEKRGKLIINERFEMDSGREEKAKCDIEIYKKEGEQYEVVLTTPDFEEYKDIPVDYFFEEFATGIKKHYLNNVPSNSIKWIERVKFHTSEFHPPYEESYKLTFDGVRYSGFDFEKCIVKKLNILAKKVNPTLKGDPYLVPVRHRRIPYSPANGFQKFRAANIEMKFWEKAEAQSFLAFTNNRYPKKSDKRWVYVVYLLALNTGL